MNINKQIGQQGENIAAKYLIDKGYKIIESNFHSRYGEIDIIAQDNDTICFVEVKNYSSNNLLNINYAISPSKRKKIISTAKFYIAKNKVDSMPCRFDAIFITGKKIEHLEGAFY